MRSLLRVVVILAAAVLAAPSPAQEAVEGRVAVVLGNGGYQLGRLNNPPNDAGLIASSLGALGFDVYQAVDLSTEGFEDFYTSIEDQLRDADVLFVYYAGHAFQYKGDNRLLMIDATADSLDTIVSHSLSLSALVERLAALNPHTLVLALDACRDNPFLQSDEIQSGLSYMETSAGQVMIGYATSAGQVAYDGNGSNSPYAVALANALLEPDSDGRALSAVFRDVRREVREATGGLQIPWVSSSVEDEVVLDAERIEVVLSTSDENLPSLDEILWYFVHNSRDPEDLEAYLGAFPRGVYASDARSIMDVALGSNRGIFVGTEDTGTGQPAGEQLAAPVFATTGDRTPPLALREWPADLPIVADGLGTLSDDCAELASDPDDPARVAPGVQIGLVNIRKAVSSCVVALLRHPDDARTQFHMGRALDAAGQYIWAAAYYEQATARGYGAAMVNLGFLYRNGRGLEKDDGKAFRLYMDAALLGNQRARTNVGTLFRNGWGVAQSFEEAILWYRLAGSNGWPNAIDALGGMYAQGQGVTKDAEQAAKLYRLAAEIGQTNAMNSLGKAYLNGSGVPKDEVEGVRWLQAGVDAGNSFAAQSLGRYLVDSDPARAEELFLMSAERGFAAARLDLAKLYRSRGTIADAEEALYQVELAKAFGVDQAEGLIPEYQEDLPEESLARVERRVREWVTFNGN